MAKRIISLSLVLIICFSLCIVEIDAQTTDYLKSDSNPYHASDLNDYVSYCNNINSNKNATKVISMGDISSISEMTDHSGIELLNTGDKVEYTVNVEENGWYQPVIKYKAIKAQGNDILVSIKVDGEVPYTQLNSIPLTRVWVDATKKINADSFGNEFSPEQKEMYVWQASSLHDSNGFIKDNMLIWLTEGNHTFTITLVSEKVRIAGISLEVPEKVISDSEWKESIKDQNLTVYKGEEIVLEGEHADKKSSRFLSPLSNRSNAAVLPSNPYSKRINYIGGNNWKNVGDTLTWSFKVKESGLYKIGFHFHQTYLQESSSYRTLRIDGKIPFRSAEAIDFSYDTSWQFLTLGNESGAVPVYLTKGNHELSLTVTLGKLSDFSSELRDLTAEIGNIYRQVVMITGETPDPERDYNLFSSLPNLESDLTRIRTTLENMANESEELVGSKGGASAQILRKTSLTISQMLKVKYKAQTKLGAFYDNYSALSSWLYEMQNMALDIDCIVLASPEKDFVRSEQTFFQALSYNFLRLLASFSENYISQESKESEKSITLWSNWGMDQLTVLSSLIESDFTPKTNIKVNLKITNASVIQGNLSGNGPDVEIMLARTDPVNYAMRNAVLDLSQFEDFDSVSTRFLPVSFEPYKYNDGIYALPDTQTFSMLFVRTDIFDELDIKIPKTWDEFLQVSKVLALNNMQVAVSEGAPFFLSQKGVSLYNETFTATNLLSPQALNCLTFWTDLYTKYNLPKSYDFYSRFRSGLIPMGIQPISFYSVFKSAAPEINGKWIIAEVPGYKNKNGGIDNIVIGSGNASVILKGSKNKEAAWEFLKWWTSNDIQYRFASNIESVLGESGRHLTANTYALKNLGWDGESLSALLSQRDKLVEIREIPGSYYVTRSIQQIYWNVVNSGKNVREMAAKWVPEADEEIERKIAEYTE